LYLAERVLAQSSSSDANRADVLTELRARYPSPDPMINHRLSRILSMHPDDDFVSKTLPLLEKAASPSEQFHYAFVLRNVSAGWNAAARSSYFEHLRRLEDLVSGEGMPTFRKLIRQEALAALPPEERPAYEKLLASAAAPWTGELQPARTKLVRKWTAEELSAAWTDAKSERDLKRGKTLFAEARCIVCHRAGSAGGVSGPDLTSVARRFSPRDILISIIEPSKAIDEKYAAEVLELADGRVVTGRIAAGDYRSPDLEIVTNLLEPQKTFKLPKGDVVRREASPVSAMPSGLLDGFRQDEILDLLAFLLAAERAPN
jgi:putative heme-binding domain-containing protein